MGRTINILLLVLLMAVAINLLGQQKANSKTPANSKGSAKRIFMPTVYLGNSDYRGGPIKKDEFATLLKQGLTSHDSLGNKYRVIGFDFSYAERKVYEDSVGNLVMMTDHSSEYCFGDTISHNIATTDTTVDGEAVLSIYDRAKPGDTVYFDHVMVVKHGHNSLLTISDTTVIAARGIKCVIVK